MEFICVFVYSIDIQLWVLAGENDFKVVFVNMCVEVFEKECSGGCVRVLFIIFIWKWKVFIDFFFIELYIKVVFKDIIIFI